MGIYKFHSGSFDDAKEELFKQMDKRKTIKIKYICKCGYELIIYSDVIRKPRDKNCPRCDIKMEVEK